MILLLFLTIFRCSGLYLIAVNEDPPFSACSVVFSGYEVDLVREALSLYGWRYEEQYQFICADSTANATSYSAVVGRMPHSTYKYANGYDYSYPTQNNRLGLIVYSSSTITVGTYISIFDSYIWIVVLGAAAVVVVCLTFIEHIPEKKFEFWLKSFRIINWISFSTVFFGEQNHNYRLPSKILILGFLGFLSLIYCLFLAGSIYQTLIDVKLVDFPEKLEKLRYTTYSEYLEYTSIYGGIYIDTGITSANINDKISLLSSGYLDAIVMEYESISNIAGDNCDFIVSSKPFLSFFYAVELQPGVDPELKQALDFGLTALVRHYDVQSLQNGYFYSSLGCSSNVNTIAPIGMYDLFEAFVGYTGLFIIVFFLRRVLNKRELIKERNKFIVEIKDLISQPESKILKIAHNQIRNVEKDYVGLMEELKRNMKKNIFIQEKLMNLMRAKESQGK